MKVKSIVSISFIFFLLIISRPAYAENELTTIPTQGISPTPTAAPTSVNYELPYPGILPGSPLYALKALRDKFLEILISDPIKKSNFYLLQADKRLASSLKLFENGDAVSSETTFSKGQNYLEKSLEQTIIAKNLQHNISDILAKIRMSSSKQKEEVKKLINKSKGENQQRFKKDYGRAVDLENRAKQIKP